MNSRRQRHRAERIYQLQVWRNLRRNYLAHLVHGMLGQTGFSLLMAPTFMPAYVLLLSGNSHFTVGLVQSLQHFGMMVTPLLGAHMIAHRRKVLNVGLLTGSGMRLMVLCIALSGLLLPPPWALTAIFLFITLFGVFTGIQGVIFHFLMSKMIPVRKRGWLTGLRNFLAGLTASAVAWLAGDLFFSSPIEPEGYSHTFLLAFLLTSIGLASLLLVREPESPRVRDRSTLKTRLWEIPGLLRGAPGFGPYVMARAIATMGRMSMPFYVLFAGSNIGLNGQVLATLTVAFTMSSTISNLVWGFIADRTGFRFVMLFSIVLWILATLGLLFVDGLWLATLVFACIGVGSQGFQNSSINMTLEFGHRQDLPMRIALANTAAEFTGALGPVLGGILVTLFSYTAVFGVSVAFLILGGMAVLLLVPEPRRHKT